MYIVVFLKEAKKRLVVPDKWIMDFEIHMAKFLNYGLNRNQIYHVYWTENTTRFDENGVPDCEFKPNFGALSKGNGFPKDGLYECYL